MNSQGQSHVSTFECTRKQANQVTYTTSKAIHGIQACIKLLEQYQLSWQCILNNISNHGISNINMMNLAYYQEQN